MSASPDRSLALDRREQLGVAPGVHALLIGIDHHLFPPPVADLCRDRALLAIMGPHDGTSGLDCESLKNWLG